MKTSNRIQISGDFKTLFDTAANIARWPQILPHYRWVKILERSNGRVVAEMAARHKGVPLWWRTIQRPLYEEKRILFSHIGGITKGMEVQWRFDQAGESCLGPAWLVQIEHEFNPSWPAFLRYWLGERIIGETFVKQVANKTLTCVKRLVESGG